MTFEVLASSALVLLLACGGQTELGSNRVAGDEQPASAGGTASGGGTGVEKNEPYLPLVVGARWAYTVTDNTTGRFSGEKKHAVLEESAGLFKLEITGVDSGWRWLQDTGSAYLWVRNLYVDADNQPNLDQYYDPPALRFDYGHAKIAERWSSTYLKHEIDLSRCPSWSEELAEENLVRCPQDSISTKQITETWTITAVEYSVTVPASSAPFSTLCETRNCTLDDPTTTPPTGTCKQGVYCFARGVGKVWENTSQREELTSFEIPRP